MFIYNHKQIPSEYFYIHQTYLTYLITVERIAAFVNGSIAVCIWVTYGGLDSIKFPATDARCDSKFSIYYSALVR